MKAVARKIGALRYGGNVDPMNTRLLIVTTYEFTFGIKTFPWGPLHESYFTQVLYLNTFQFCHSQTKMVLTTSQSFHVSRTLFFVSRTLLVVFKIACGWHPLLVVCCVWYTVRDRFFNLGYLRSYPRDRSSECFPILHPWRVCWSTQNALTRRLVHPPISTPWQHNPIHLRHRTAYQFEPQPPHTRPERIFSIHVRRNCECPHLRQKLKQKQKIARDSKKFRAVMISVTT